MRRLGISPGGAFVPAVGVFKMPEDNADYQG